MNTNTTSTTDRNEATEALAKAAGAVVGTLVGAVTVGLLEAALDAMNEKSLKDAKAELKKLENSKYETLVAIANLRWYQIIRRADLRCKLDTIEEDIDYCTRRIARLEKLVTK